VIKKLLPVQQAVTRIKALGYFLTNPSFNFLTAATPHRRIFDPCCFLPQSEACAFQKSISENEPAASKNKRGGVEKSCLQTLVFWGFDVVLVQTQRFQRSETGAGEVPTPQK